MDSSLRWNDGGSGEGFEITTQARDCASALLRRPSGDVSRQGDCRELKQMEYGPLDIVPYQLKNKKDTPRSGPSDRCCNPFTLMMEVFSGPDLAHRTFGALRVVWTCTTLTVQPALGHEPGSGHQKPAPLDGRAGYPGGVKSGCLTRVHGALVPLHSWSRPGASPGQARLYVRFELPDLQPDLKAETLAAPSTRSDAGNIEQNRNIVKCFVCLNHFH